MEMYKANDNRYADMAYRRCGRSGLLLPVISLGLWHNFGSVDVFSNFIQIAYAAFDNGITHFDLANNYGPVYGSAEENFGRILKKGLGQYRDELVISTKAGYDMWPGPYGNWGSRKYLMASLDQSLKRMGLEYVDIFYSHRPDPETPLDEDNMAEAIPAYLAIVAMPLFYSISEGISMGIISYVVLHVLSGKGKQVKPLMYVLAVLFVLKYIFL